MKFSINHEEMNLLLSLRSEGSNDPENHFIQANKKAAADFSERARPRLNAATGNTEFWADVEMSGEEFAIISRDRAR
jgi:hypothetical protein